MVRKRSEVWVELQLHRVRAITNTEKFVLYSCFKSLPFSWLLVNNIRVTGHNNSFIVALLYLPDLGKNLCTSRITKKYE